MNRLKDMQCSDSCSGSAKSASVQNSRLSNTGHYSNTAAAIGKGHLGTAIEDSRFGPQPALLNRYLLQESMLFRPTNFGSSDLADLSSGNVCGTSPTTIRTPPTTVYDVGDTHPSSSYARDNIPFPHTPHICADMLIVRIGGFGRISTASKLTGFSCEHCLGMGLSRSLVMRPIG